MRKKKQNAPVKKIVDVCLTVLLFCLMSYQVVGEVLHEWIGIGMTVVLIVHHILNLKWYGALFKGKYNAYRIATTVINTLLLASIALTAFCGMSMSNYAVPFLYGMAGIIFARTVHLALSFWSFLLMGLHLGLHLPAMTAKVKPGKAAKVICSSLFTVIAGIGLWLFIRNGIPDYLSFRTHFAFFDYDKAPVLVFLENIAIEFFFVFIGANLFRLLRSKKKRKQALIAALCVLLAVGIGFGLQALFPSETETFPDWSTPSWEAPPQTEWCKENEVPYIEDEKARKALAAAQKAVPLPEPEQPITVLLHYHGAGENARSFAEEMEVSGIADAIRAEDGNLRYQYFQPLNDPETILLIDCWRDQAALDAHHASPMMAQLAALREKYNLNMTVERYISAGESLADERFIRR